MPFNSRLKNTIRRGEEALRAEGFGITADPANAPAREAAVRAYEEAYDGAVEDGETEEAAHQKGLKTAIDAYLSTPPVGAYEGTYDDAGGRVVYHPDVARVYAEHPDASEVHDCEDCGLGIPGHTGIIRGGRTIPFRRYFDSCPNCGGRVGYNAYLHKHKAEEAGEDGR